MDHGSQQSANASRSSLVAGTVVAGPVSPLARVGVPATRPVHRAIVQALRESDIMAVTHTDAAGRYELMLQPGTYVILARVHERLPSKQGKTVTIGAGETRTVDFVLDTGIR